MSVLIWHLKCCNQRYRNVCVYRAQNIRSLESCQIKLTGHEWSAPNAGEFMYFSLIQIREHNYMNAVQQGPFYGRFHICSDVTAVNIAGHGFKPDRKLQRKQSLTFSFWMRHFLTILMEVRIYQEDGCFTWSWMSVWPAGCEERHRRWI